MGSRVRFVKLSAAALVGVSWISPWRAPAEPAQPAQPAQSAPPPVAAPEPAPDPAPARDHVLPASPASRSRPAVRRARPRPIDVWRALAQCESNGDPLAVSPDGRYFGAFQFELASWQLVGMSGSPIDHPYDVQLDAARRLHVLQGWGAWPVCARRLGLLL